MRLYAKCMLRQGPLAPWRGPALPFALATLQHPTAHGRTCRQFGLQCSHLFSAKKAKTASQPLCQAEETFTFRTFRKFVHTPSSGAELLDSIASMLRTTTPSNLLRDTGAHRRPRGPWNLMRMDDCDPSLIYIVESGVRQRGRRLATGSKIAYQILIPIKVCSPG